jgi:peptidoglycan hydrolase-like protein with peptidoglycan-binding domain
MPPIDRIAIIQFIRTLADFPKITEEQVQEVDAAYQLTKGRQTQNQIPVELAVEKVITENSISNKLTSLINYVNNHPNLEGAKIFKDVVVNKYRVLSAFADVNLTQMNLEDFIKLVNSNFLELGFSAVVNTLEQNEWQSLFNYMKNVLGTASV